jgi:hypothetical protein
MLGGNMKYKACNDAQENVVDSQDGIKINLQLFAGDNEEDLSEDDSWDDSDDDEADDSESPDEDGSDDESENNPEFANLGKSKAKQTKDEQTIYADMRRRALKEEKDLLEREREELQRAKKELEEEKRINSISQEAIWQKADEEGVSEDAARKMLILEEKNKLITERESRINRETEIRDQKKTYKNEMYFAELEQDIDNMMAQYPDVTVEGAFHYLRSVKLKELMDGKLKKKEQQTIANLHDKAKRRSVSADASDSFSAKSTGLTKKLSEVWGFNDNDLQDIQKHNSRRKKELKKN